MCWASTDSPSSAPLPSSPASHVTPYYVTPPALLLPNPLPYPASPLSILNSPPPTPPPPPPPYSSFPPFPSSAPALNPPPVPSLLPTPVVHPRISAETREVSRRESEGEEKE